MESNEIVQLRTITSDGSMKVYEGEQRHSQKAGEKKEEIVLCEADIKEVKMETCYKEVCTPLGCVEVPYPCLHERTCTYELKLTYYYPGDFENEVKKCLNEAAVVGAVAALPFLAVGEFTSALKAGTEAFIPAFEACLSDDIEKQVTLEFGVARKPKESGGKPCEWKRV